MCQPFFEWWWQSSNFYQIRKSHCSKIVTIATIWISLTLPQSSAWDFTYQVSCHKVIQLNELFICVVRGCLFTLSQFTMLTIESFVTYFTLYVHGLN